MADGTTKPIGEVRVGDRVMAEDPETGERGPRTVTHVWVHGDDLVDFRIADDVVTTTEDHPFWNATDGTWQGPEEFDAGDRVLTADGNLLVTGGLVASSWHTGSAYNLTVDGIHTYYVVVAGEAVLVHNTCWGTVDQVMRSLERGSGASSRVRVVGTGDELLDLWGDLVPSNSTWVKNYDTSYGPIEVYRLPDGTTATWRYDSSSGGPTIEFISSETGSKWKVHVG